MKSIWGKDQKNLVEVSEITRSKSHIIMRKTTCIQITVFLTCMHTLCLSQTSKDEKSIDTTKNTSFCVSEPSFPGGTDSLMAFVKRNLKWPVSDDFVRGTVYVTFIVDTSGAIIDPKVLKGMGLPYDTEALRIVSMMQKWNPAIEFINNRRQPVQTQWNLPFKFSLQ